MIMKRCTKCDIEKTIDEYNTNGKKKNGEFKYRSRCKACLKEKNKEYREEHKEHIKERKKQYREQNKTKIRQQKKQHYEKNKNKLNEYRKNRRANDLEFKIQTYTRNRINDTIRSQLNNDSRSGKSAHTHELLGISMDKYIRYIEFQFKNEWTWDNWGSDFHIDQV